MSATGPSAVVQSLRARMERVQPRRADAAVLPVVPVLSDLLPDGGLRAGTAYTVAPSASLLLTLLARPSREGAWCAAIGMPELGAEAAAQLGVDLSRLVLIPDPGPSWLAVTTAVVDVLPLVAVRPPARARDGDVPRLQARLRERGCTLIVEGAWPRAEASLGIVRREWAGVGRGHGLLRERVVTVAATGRRWAGEKRVRMLLPDRTGAAAPVTAPTVDVGHGGGARIGIVRDGAVRDGAVRDGAVADGAVRDAAAAWPMRAVG